MRITARTNFTILASLIAFLTLPLLAAYHLPTHDKPSAQPSPVGILKLGAVVAISGAYANEGRETREGYDFWRDYVNTHDGLKIGNRRYRVEIVYLDDGSNPNNTSLMTQRLIDVEHVSFLLGPYGSAENFAAAAIAERRGIPMVEGAGSLEKIYDQGYRYTFGVMSPARKYLAGLIEFAATRHPRIHKAAILAASDGFSLEVQQGAIQLANDHGINVVVSQRYSINNQDFSDIAQRIAQAHAEIVLDAGHLSEAIALHRALAANSVRAKLYGYTVGPDTPAFSKSLGPLADEVMGSAQWSESIPASGSGSGVFYRTAQQYAAAFRRRYHHQANYHNAAASASALALQVALEKSHSIEATQVRQTLSTLNIPSFFGNIRFDSRGVNMYKSMVVNQLQNGRLVTIYPRRAAQAAPEYPATPWQAR